MKFKNIVYEMAVRYAEYDPEVGEDGDPEVAVLNEPRYTTTARAALVVLEDIGCRPVRRIPYPYMLAAYFGGIIALAMATYEAACHRWFDASMALVIGALALASYIVEQFWKVPRERWDREETSRQADTE